MITFFEIYFTAYNFRNGVWMLPCFFLVLSVLPYWLRTQVVILNLVYRISLGNWHWGKVWFKTLPKTWWNGLTWQANYNKYLIYMKFSVQSVLFFLSLIYTICWNLSRFKISAFQKKTAFVPNKTELV